MYHIDMKLTREQVLEQIIRSCHNLEVNLNDTFWYATAYSENIPATDILDLISYLEEYSIDDVINAYVALKIEEDPTIPAYLTKDFYKIKQILSEKMSESQSFLADLNFNIRKQKEQIKKYGGKLSFKWIEPTPIPRPWWKFWGKQPIQYCTVVCSCEGRSEKGYAHTMRDAEEDLASKILK
jgi:hypothetical protein